jgi:RND family efflux transporter MFP subunit
MAGSLWARVAVTAALLGLAACSAAPADSADAGGGQPKAGGGAGGRGGRGGGITLSASDVANVRRALMEEATAVTGDLRPLETVDVRARIDADLDAVYAREGQSVRAGQLLARFDDSQQAAALRSAQAAVASAKVDLSTAEWNETQTRELFQQGAVAEQVLKSAEGTAAAARARLAAAEAALRAASDTEVYTRVVAPVNGIVAKRDAEVGEHIARGSSLFTVVRNEVLELTAAVPARQANGIVPGQTVRFRVDGQQYEGRVARVSPTIDPLSRSVTVYVQMPNPGGAIKGGTFATGRVVRRVLANALVVPATAIHQRPNTGAPFVYLIAGDDVAESDVTLGANDDAQELVEVLSGVNEGDEVIVGNVGMLGKGMRVQVLGAEGPDGRRGPGGGLRPGRPGGIERPGSGSGSNGTRGTRGGGSARGPEASASPNPSR